MADPVSALEARWRTGRMGRPGATGVFVTEITGFTLTQFAAWPDTLKRTADVVARAAGAPAPGPGGAASGPQGALLRVEPLKWWLIRAGTPGHLHVASDLGMTLDLTSSRTVLQVSGPAATTLLNHFLPLDLRPVSFPDNAVASSAIHHVGVTLWRFGGAFTLFLPRSFTASLWEVLGESAAQYGLDVSKPTEFSRDPPG